MTSSAGAAGMATRRRRLRRIPCVMSIARLYRAERPDIIHHVALKSVTVRWHPAATFPRISGRRWRRVMGSLKVSAAVQPDRPSRLAFHSNREIIGRTRGRSFSYSAASTLAVSP